MASASFGPLAERSDVHKSCKSIETLVNVLNDYCEASNSVASVKKKLTKALRETASMKATGEIAGNTLAASAVIFEVMTDIDTKFGKIADRECDHISSEVKKWFKKLAKEEKIHDERMNTANTRIKQAGQMYEKKSKRNPRDATEEHSRYINLISTLGPEVSQEKYNHALSVTQKHISTTQSIAATLARLADSEWTRSCEQVRRFSPAIGSVGEWRALCEGGWTGTVPQDLPDLDSDAQANSTQPYQHPPQIQATPSFPLNMGGRPEQTPRYDQAGVTPLAPPFSPRTATVTAEPFLYPEPSLPKSTLGQPTTPQVDSPPKPANPPPTSWQSEHLDPPKPGFAGNGSGNWTDTVGSVASLSAFPSPPTHYPVATTSGEGTSSSRPLSIQPQTSISTSSPSTQIPGPLLTDSPHSQRNELESPDTSAPGSTVGNQEEKEKEGESNILTLGKSSSPGTTELDPKRSPSPYSRTRRASLRLPESQQGGNKPSPSSSMDEFGVNQALAHNPPKFNTGAQGQGMVRNSSTTSAGSVVAAMRNRYSHNPGSSSPPTKDVPKLPLSVGDLASRYQLMDSPTSPRRRVASPIDDRGRQGRTLEVASPRPTHLPKDRSPDGAYIRFPSPSTEANMEELTRRRREKEEAERQEEARLIGEAKMEIERRTRELERDSRDNGDSANGNRVGYTSQRPNNLSQEPLRRYSQFDSPTPAISRARYHSTTHLVPPPSSSFTYLPIESQSQPPSPADRGQSSSLGHADFCGCATCSASKYRTRNTPSPHDLRPPEPPINLRPEKPKGWIRRLSMPVGNAFSLDSKKSNSSLRNVPLAGEDGRIRRSFEKGGISNRSVTNLTRR